MPPEMQFFEKLQKLDEILNKHSGAPSAFDELSDLLSDHDVYRAFVNKLNRADWITTLRKAGYFNHPPSSIQTPKGDIQHTIWPSSRYLAKMALQSPTQVAKVFSEINTDNIYVIGDMIDAALKMPCETASLIVPSICRVAKEEKLWIRFKDATDLCIHLAKGSELKSATTLLDALFKPILKKGEEEPQRQDIYWYKDGLKKIVPIFADLEPKIFLPMLCNWLNAAVEAKNVNRETGADYSYSWRPAIEEHEQNRDYDFAGVLVGFVRRGIEIAVESKHLSLEAVLHILDSYRYFVFKRISLHLINEFAEDSVDLACKTMLDHDLFESLDFKHEYAMLVGRRLDLLSNEQRNAWFQWIDAGPDLTAFNARSAPEVKEQEQEHWVRYWKFNKLHWVRRHLKGETKELYDQMHAEYGEPELADLNARVGTVHWGFESPTTVDDLAEKTFEQAVDYISNWKPDKSQFQAARIEGLASTFAQYVSKDVTFCSHKATSLIGRPATFVRAFISQMREAAKSGSQIDIPTALELCEWIIGRPIEERTTPIYQFDEMVDKDWRWTRDEISSFIINICQARTNNVPTYPLSLREPIWKLIRSLCHDRSESYIIHDVLNEDPRIHDYLHLGINSSAGRAVEAALEYARWIAFHIKKLEGQQEVVPGGFDSIPEVRQIIESQISPGNRSIEVMSIIGSRINLIYWIDKGWLETNANLLFHLEGIEQSPLNAHGWAAWNAFLVWVKPHFEFYRIFKHQFEYAITQAAKVTLSENTREQPMFYLGEHLMVLYARGQIDLDDGQGPLRQFILNSNSSIRRHAISFVGSYLKSDDKAPEEMVERFMTLWDFYWSDRGKKDAHEKSSDYLFGLWFESCQFPHEWALDRMEQYATVAATPEPIHSIVKLLTELVSVDPSKSIRILDRIIKGDSEGWRIASSIDSIREILEKAMRTPGEHHSTAISLTNYLGRLGYTDLGQLLNLT